MAFGVCFGRGMENLRAPKTGLGVVSRLGWYDGKQNKHPEVCCVVLLVGEGSWK